MTAPIGCESGGNSQEQIEAANAGVSTYCACVLESLAMDPAKLVEAGDAVCAEQAAAAKTAFDALPNKQGENVTRLTVARKGCDDSLANGKTIAAAAR